MSSSFDISNSVNQNQDVIPLAIPKTGAPLPIQKFMALP